MDCRSDQSFRNPRTLTRSIGYAIDYLITFSIGRDGMNHLERLQLYHNPLNTKLRAVWAMFQSGGRCKVYLW